MSSKNKKRSVSPSDKGEGAAPNVPVVDGSGSPPPPPPTPTDSGKSGGSKGDNGKSGSKSPFGDLWGGAKKFLSSVLSPIPIATAVANSTREWLQGPRTNGPQGSRANGPHDPRANELRDTRRNLDVAELNQKRSDILGNDINDRVRRYYVDGVLDRRDDWLSSMVPGSKSFRDTKAARVLDSIIDQGSYEKRRIELQRAYLAGKGDPTLARGSSARAEAIRQANSVAYWERRSAMRARDQAYWDHWKQQNAERRAAKAAQLGEKKENSGQPRKTLQRSQPRKTPQSNLDLDAVREQMRQQERQMEAISKGIKTSSALETLGSHINKTEAINKLLNQRPGRENWGTPSGRPADFSSPDDVQVEVEFPDETPQHGQNDTPQHGQNDTPQHGQNDTPQHSQDTAREQEGSPPTNPYQRKIEVLSPKPLDLEEGEDGRPSVLFDPDPYETRQAYGGGETFGTYRVNSNGRHSRQGLSVDKLALLRASFGYA